MDQGKNNQNQETDFVSFYLEQENKKSNVYYASAREATLYYKILPGKVVYKKTRLKVAVSMAAILLLVASSGAFFFASQQKTRSAAESAALVENGYKEILSAQEALAQFRFKQSFFDFNSAHRSFGSARTDASYLSALALNAAQYWPINLFADNGGAVADSQNELARAGLEAADNAGIFLKAAQAGDVGNLTGALNDIKSSQDNLKEIKEKLESSGDASLAGIAARIESVVNRFEYIIPRLELAVWASGFDRPKTFLIVAQNTDQARATGGAIVAVGAITFENGRASEISFDDVYNIDGQLQTKVIPPKPVQKIDTVWSLHNANWFLDFPTSAQKIAYFYQKSQGVYPDGVIAVNEKALERFLKITGSVELLKYDLTVDESNFGHLTAFNILDEKRVGQAKRVFNDFTAELFGKLLAVSEDKRWDLFNLIKENIARKDVLVWLNDQKHERFISEARWGGAVPDAPDADYLALVTSDMSVAGSAAAVEQSISKESDITDRGEIINTVRVERRRNSDGFSEKLPSVPALEYWRLYAPAGSEIISVSGFTPPESAAPANYPVDEFKTDNDVVFSEKTIRFDTETSVQIFQESGKTVFGGWTDISFKEPAVVTFKYKLPFLAKAQNKIDFVFQKQPGVESKLNFKAHSAGDPEPVLLYDGDFAQDMSIEMDK